MAGRILKVGSDREILQLKGPHTQTVDLSGKAVLPGLMESHVHPADACLTEFDHPIPEMETIQDVLGYIQRRAAVVKEGEWIQLRQVFITRLREQRYPTKDELDRVAPKHPVVFSTGPDASLNSLAFKLSGMYRDFKVTDGGPGSSRRTRQMKSRRASCAVVPVLSKAVPAGGSPTRKTQRAVA